MPLHRWNEQWVARGAQLEPAVAGDGRLDAVYQQREPGPSLEYVEFGRGVDRALKIARARAQRIGECEQDASHFFDFLLLELDDVVVDLNGAERFEEEAGAAAGTAVHDSRNRGAMLTAHDEHVAAVS